jgi:GH43 family beta-xylosidase
MLTASSASDLLKADSWKKSPEPVFSTSVENGVYGPGHNGFFKSPDGTEDWIVYHAKSVANGECRERNVRIQKFTWNADGTPNFGNPVSIKTSLQKPSGE